MKRCNNCGWYNRNELTKCEKCGEPLGLPLEELAALEEKENAREVQPEPARPARTYSATMRDTGAAMKAIGGEPEARVCPKCSYPLAGDDEICPNCGAKLRGTTRKDAAHAAPAAAPAPNPYNATVRDIPGQHRAQAPKAPAKMGKETMREIPKELTETEPEPSQEIFKLVSVSDPNYPDVYLSVGDIVTIGSRRFRFEK
jgi:hypothetical protein